MEYLKKDIFNFLKRSGKFILTIDGFGASGKKTIAKELSKQLELPYLYTGAFYRALAYECINEDIDTSEGIETSILLNKFYELDEEDFDNPKLKNDERIAKIASQISQVDCIRNEINSRIINFVNKNPQCIISGRNLHTIFSDIDDVFPILLQVNEDEGVKRRYIQEKFVYKRDVDLKTIEKKLKSRNKRDSRYFKNLDKNASIIKIDTTDILGINENGEIWGIDKTVGIIIKKLIDKINHDSISKDDCKSYKRIEL